MAQIVTAKNGQTNGIEYPRTVKSALLNDDGTPLNPLTQTNIINDLTTGGETNVLSAQQGVALNSAIGQKADKQQPAWQTATLLNGWLGTIKYRKNTLGNLELNGVINDGVTTTGTTLFTLPVGYAPVATKYIIALKHTNSTTGSSIVVIRIGADGNVGFGIGTQGDKYVVLDSGTINLD